MPSGESNALVVQYFTISVSASFSFETNPTIKPQLKGNLPRKVNQIYKESFRR